jgi:hypothetical protein
MYPHLLSMPRLLRSGLSSGADFQDPNLFFHYTIRHWLDNETEEQQRRDLTFSLKAAAIAAVDGVKSVLHMTKLPEGSYSKVFSKTLDNQQEAIARLPMPHAGPAHLVTVSEVVNGVCMQASWLTSSPCIVMVLCANFECCRCELYHHGEGT